MSRFFMVQCVYCHRREISKTKSRRSPIRSIR